MKILLGFRWLGEYLLYPAPSQRHPVCAGKVWAEILGVVLKKCLMAPVMEMKSQFLSQPLSGAQQGVLCVLHRCFYLQKRDAAAPGRTWTLLFGNTLVLYLGVGLKTTNKCNTLKSNTGNNSLRPEHWRVCSKWHFGGWTCVVGLDCKCSAEGRALICQREEEPGWMGPWATRSTKRHPCPWQKDWS